MSKPEFLGIRAAPAGRRHEEVAGSRSRGAPAGRSEHVGPHVEHRQQIIAPAGVGRRDDHRLLGQIEPAARIERVEIRPHHDAHVGGGKCSDIGEAVHRAADASRGRLLIGELLPGQVHGHRRIEIEIGVDADGMRLLLGDRAAAMAAGAPAAASKSPKIAPMTLHLKLLLALVCREPRRLLAAECGAIARKNLAQRHCCSNGQDRRQPCRGVRRSRWTPGRA